MTRVYLCLFIFISFTGQASSDEPVGQGKGQQSIDLGVVDVVEVQRNGVRFNEAVLHLGEQDVETKLHAEFKLRNVTDKELQLNAVSSSCSCTQPSIARGTIRPDSITNGVCSVSVNVPDKFGDDLDIAYLKIYGSAQAPEEFPQLIVRIVTSTSKKN